MLILIKSPTITFSLEVQPEDDVQVLNEKIEVGRPISRTGIKEETTIQMSVIKEMSFIVLYNNFEHPLTIPNNDGITIATLQAQIKIKLKSDIPLLATHDSVLKKAGNPTVLTKTQLIHSTLSNNEVLEMELVEAPPVPAGADEDVFDQEALLKSFAETSISSDVEIVFCFDTTGSMASIIQNVRTQVESTVSRLIKDIPNIRIGIMGLGDYCDAAKVLTTLDLTQNLEELVQFIKNVPATSGGDAPEAYEWALRKAKTLSWSTHTSKAFVMIGDANPHEPSHTNLSINWFEECDDLYDMGVKIYGVKALGNSPFYEEIAMRTGGVCINFKNFSFITEMFLAICYREASKEKFKQFESELANKIEQNNDMSSIMADLNKDNFEVVCDGDGDGSSSNDNSINTTTSSSSTSSPSNKITKIRGKPTTMRCTETWFDHDKDRRFNANPTYYFHNNLGHFTTKFFN
ncbi:hypothetical protein SAMD00019534_070240 [Acytostelium subglobosum LB1]|uniref:hypothetical protein n=1 Tax=Acytostelium subglobosum LB1 TaxID=1410327 RepID=UPI000644BB94|nr:hypothetical protein SAMD00019534_070240 [Acytostelium subglobosum LB1]GAM23849.1 hypothetical protein SAMD00019534_070240 [Acytostelium subglobosum LB1]|eukprot:XP_012752885.1 hypothetical protein SAMD00019534_070240 [Acytostelium subglobosum LB1]